MKKSFILMLEPKFLMIHLKMISSSGRARCQIFEARSETTRCQEIAALALGGPAGASAAVMLPLGQNFAESLFHNFNLGNPRSALAKAVGDFFGIVTLASVGSLCAFAGMRIGREVMRRKLPTEKRLIRQSQYPKLRKILRGANYGLIAPSSSISQVVFSIDYLLPPPWLEYILRYSFFLRSICS